MAEKSIVLENAQKTRDFGGDIARIIDSSAVITLSGPLGAGKTTFAQGVAEGLGVDETVTSPTFTMMNEYDSGRLQLFHLDLYRLHETTSTAEFPLDLQMLAAELDEILQAPGVVLVEWPEYFAKYFSSLDRLEITLQYDTEGEESGNGNTTEPARRAILHAHGPGATRIVEALSR